MKTRSYDSLCKAAELTEKSLEFYSKAYEACDAGPGKDVFSGLVEDTKKRLSRINALSARIGEGESWEAACTLDETFSDDVHDMFRNIVGKHGAGQSCATNLGAVEQGLRLSQETLDWFSAWVGEAASEREKAFIRQLVEEERAHALLLLDLKEYYTDPEAWYTTQHTRLDGA